MSSADEPRTLHRAGPLVSALLTRARFLGRDIRAIESRTTLVIDVLALSDVVQYFVEERPAEPAISAGALLRQRRNGTGQPDRYFQFFLDGRGRSLPDRHGVPYGRIVEAARVDEELAAAFAKHDNDLLIFR
jgi:hypothetical protein